MPETGIDWDHYDHGPGSEEWKRKMAAEKCGYANRAQIERRREVQRLAAKAAGRAKTAKRLEAIVARIPRYTDGPPALAGDIAYQRMGGLIVETGPIRPVVSCLFSSRKAAEVERDSEADGE